MKKDPEIQFAMNMEGLRFFKDEDTAWTEEDVGWLCDCFHRVEDAERDYGDEAPWEMAQARGQRLLEFLMAMEELGVQVTEVTFKQRPEWLRLLGRRKGGTP
jgi:hypothetical protein